MHCPNCNYVFKQGGGRGGMMAAMLIILCVFAVILTIRARRYNIKPEKMDTFEIVVTKPNLGVNQETRMAPKKELNLAAARKPSPGFAPPPIMSIIPIMVPIECSAHTRGTKLR